MIKTAIKIVDGWMLFYGAGIHFIQGKKKTLPVYEIQLLEVPDLNDLSK